MPSIIQFLHTAEEASPSSINSNIIQWNNSKNHKRKFILSKGKHIIDNMLKEDKLVFWGEWEAQSKIIKLKNQLPYLPKYLNQPFLDNSFENKIHNTDPYVFGKHFKYLICQQKTNELLRKLEPYSMILFGSNINNKFCLDTIFIVSDNSKTYKTNSLESVFNYKNQYYYASVQQLENNRNNTEYRFYKGVQYDNRRKYSGIYSFVPSKIYTPNSEHAYIFKQPEINLDIINHKLTKGINSSNNRNFTRKEIAHYWNEIAKQIEELSLLRGVEFGEIGI
jgi:hypothetical protein